MVSPTPRPLVLLVKIRYAFYRRLGGPQGRSGRAENLVPTGIRSRTIQPVVSRYTDWATGPTAYIHTYLTYCTVQSPSWAANWFAASQEIPRISRNPKVHYRTHKRPPPVSILGQPNPIHIPTFHFLQIQPNNIHPSTPRSSQWSLSSRFPSKSLYTPSPHPLHIYILLKINLCFEKLKGEIWHNYGLQLFGPSNVKLTFKSMIFILCLW